MDQKSFKFFLLVAGLGVYHGCTVFCAPYYFFMCTFSAPSL